MSTDKVIIAGGGIGGLALALTLHQIGVDCVVLESVDELRPLGVGINLQPNAVRELQDLGIDEAGLGEVGVAVREWALVARNGKEIYAEPRGKAAGYKWDQYAVHRGKFHLLLYRKVIERLGADAVRLGHRVKGYRKEGNGTVTALIEGHDGRRSDLTGAILVGADGIHSAVREQMHPGQPPINWGGTIMWRGTARGKPIRTGSSFVGLGSSRHRVVVYPISQTDDQGLADINWIAEKTFDGDHDWARSGWFRAVELADFAHMFDDFVHDWLDLPKLLAQAEVAYENPMIDRDPVSTWVDGQVCLLGDAAHPMYPTGSNGASQAIIDGRVLARAMLSHGITNAALNAYDEELCGAMGQVALRNRGAGPFALLNLAEERCTHDFDDMEAVFPAAERNAFMLAYQEAAGFAKDRLNAASRTIPEGARIPKRAA